MKFRTLGRTGLKVSEIGFGGWAIGGSWGHQDDQDSITAVSDLPPLPDDLLGTLRRYNWRRAFWYEGK